MSNVEHPTHYNKGKIEVIDFIEDQQLDFNAGNVVKYVCRYDMKGGVEDLQKARFYLDRLIAQQEKRVDAIPF
jgi:hypothetical protein